METELFGDLPQYSRPAVPKPFLFPGRYLRLRLAYEDIVFGGLALLLILLGGFCLGVERGKRLDALDVPPATVEKPIPATQDLALGLPPAKPVRDSLSHPAEPPGQYVIQLASYVSVDSAEKEAHVLRRRGIDTQVVKSGRYFELRAKGFRTRSEALNTLAGLRNTYRDGFVKKVM